MDKAIAQLFDLQGWIVYRTEYQQDSIHIYVGRPRKVARCPECGKVTSRVYDRARQMETEAAHVVQRKAGLSLGAPPSFSVYGL